MTNKPQKKPRKCPKCNKLADLYSEYWADHTIEFMANEDGVPENEGNIEPGYPAYVVAACFKCNHSWRLRGVKQITELQIKDQTKQTHNTQEKKW